MLGWTHAPGLHQCVYQAKTLAHISPPGWTQTGYVFEVITFTEISQKAGFCIFLY